MSAGGVPKASARRARRYLATWAALGLAGALPVAAVGGMQLGCGDERRSASTGVDITVRSRSGHFLN